MAGLLNFQGKADPQFTAVEFNDDPRHPTSTKDSSHLITSGGGFGDDLSGNIGSTASAVGGGPHFLSIAYYQQFFDVDTDQVQRRILRSFYPKHGSNFIADHVQPVPDLYGPFWISVTLVFSMAICGNIATYIQTRGQTDTPFQNDFAFVTGSTSLVTSYVLLMPFIVYSILWYRRATLQYSYLELICAYGYSLSIFIPVSVLWVVDVGPFRWLLILISVTLSGSVLVKSLWPAVKMEGSQLTAFGIIALIFGTHCLLAISFKEFYFDTAHSSTKLPPSVAHDGQPMIPNGSGEAMIHAMPTPAALVRANGRSIGKESDTGVPSKVKPESLAPAPRSEGRKAKESAVDGGPPASGAPTAAQGSGKSGVTDPPPPIALKSSKS